MKKLLDLYRLREEKGTYGLEIEVEGDNLFDYEGPIITDGWLWDRDGSLKAAQSIEYIFEKPQTLSKTVEMVKELYSTIDKKGGIIDDSFKAGVHVHVNMQDKTIVEIFTFASLYYVFEQVLLNWCGAPRNGNHFCLGISHSDYMIDTLKECVGKKSFNPVVGNDRVRYSALNWCPVGKYGSLEFRSLGTPTTPNRVVRWVRILDQLRLGAEKFRNPQDVVLSLSDIGPEGLMEQVFNKTTRGLLERDHWEGMMFENMRTIQELAFCSPWTFDRPNRNVFTNAKGW